MTEQLRNKDFISTQDWSLTTSTARKMSPSRNRKPNMAAAPIAAKEILPAHESRAAARRKLAMTIASP